MHEQAKPPYTEHHEAFRRLLIAGGITFVMGFFFGQQMLSHEAFAPLRSWFPPLMWILGLLGWSMCFIFYPKQYSIHEDSLVIEWWYLRRKAIPFHEIRELEAKSFLGKRNIIIRSRGPDYEFGWHMIAPRNAVPFSERLEEALNRHRFRAGREPIRMILEEPKPRKNKQRN